MSDQRGAFAHHSPAESIKPGKAKKQKGKKRSKRANEHADEADRYQPSPIFDDFSAHSEGKPPKLDRNFYEKELARLQVELVKMQYWVKHTGYRLILLFEGRDAAGKGGTIKRVTEPLNPRGCKVVALGTPSDQQKSQWYFQRYVEHFPSAGEILLFDRSWYNRAGVEKVMGFCSADQVEEFMQSCPEFERMLVRSGITLIKYWFSVSDEEQEVRFRSRLKDPARRWKLSPMDLESRDRWVEFSRAKDEMFARTNIPYKDMTPEAIELPPRKTVGDYQRPPLNEQFFVPNSYA